MAAPAELPAELDESQSATKAECKLTTKQKAQNIIGSTVVAVAFVGLTVATAGASLAVQAASSLVPVPLNFVAPNATKNAYYLGYLHERYECITEDGKDSGKTLLGLGPTRRGKAGANDGCFVWSLLSYHNVNSVRITVFGGGTVRRDNNGRRAVIEAKGGVITGLQIADVPLAVRVPHLVVGQLVFYVLTGNKEFYVPVHHMDQVQYVSCGDHPLQSKIHVSVVRGAPTRVTYKHAHVSAVDRAVKKLHLQSTVSVKAGVVTDLEGHMGTGSMGVSMPEKGPIIAAAEAAHVWADGSSGDAQPAEPLGIKRLAVKAIRNADFARLNPFANRGRLEQPAGAQPWQGGAFRPLGDS